jgi:hypothetical protein
MLGQQKTKMRKTTKSGQIDGNGAQNMVSVQSGFRTSDLSITGPRAYQLL